MTSEKRPTGGFTDALRVSIEARMREYEALLTAAIKEGNQVEVDRLTEFIKRQQQILDRISGNSGNAPQQ